MFTRREVLLIACVMAGTFVASLDQTVVSTAMPTVIGELGGLDRYSWVFSAYLLISATSTPVYGALADMFGRKWMYILSIAIFTSASVLAGLATSMDQLIGFRALQGLGAGGILPLANTILGDAFAPRVRARMQGLISAVWIIAAFLGPVLGGFLSEHVSWRWAFFINLPIGVFAIAVLLVAFDERVERLARKVDWLGAVAFTGTIAGLMLVLNGTLGWEALVVASLCGAIFVWQERRTPEPMVRIELIRMPTVALGLGVNLVVGILAFAQITYIPPFVQGVQGGSPVEAGVIISASSLGWSLTGIVAGFIMLRIGFKRLALLGMALPVVGTAILSFIAPETPQYLIVLAILISSGGLGLIAVMAVVAAQAEVPWRSRGTVTGLIQFSRTLGGSLGVAALAGVLNAGLGERADDANALLLHSGAASNEARAALAGGLHGVYVAMVVVAIVGLLIATRAPNISTFDPIAAPKPDDDLTIARVEGPV